jgi:tRNA-Thr(GGU) m(6)t(6)A37 methyltransferase TsaA
MTLKVIAYARNRHTDKFGIPRQSREESPILTRIVFEPDYAIPEALRGIEGYSHLWLLWGANLTPTLSTREGDKLDWSPTVRPPRLGGNKRMGVFATRSPFRPNPIGLSSVRNLTPTLSTREGVYIGESGRMELIVSGADVLDGTPIYDIKPYLSFSDSHPDAKNGFAEETKDYELEIVWTNLPITDQEKADLEYILRQDPRPGYQDNPERVYKMDYAGLRVSFRVEGLKVFVLNCERL